MFAELIKKRPHIFWVLKLHYFAQTGPQLNHILSHFSLAQTRKNPVFNIHFNTILDPSLGLSVYLFPLGFLT
jgi:hypothetical protein